MKKVLLLVLTAAEAEVINSCSFLQSQKVVETMVVMSVRTDVTDSI